MMVEIHCTCTVQIPCVVRGNGAFKPIDLDPEYCPPGEFMWEIGLGNQNSIK
jgi:hypothetical protein